MRIKVPPKPCMERRLAGGKSCLTLLVVSVDAVPTNFPELIAAIKDIPAFLASFLLLMLFWHGHWTWSRRFGLEDLPSIWLSGGLVFVVLCFWQFQVNL